MAAKKQKLVDLDITEKRKISKVGMMSLVMVALVCLIIVGCLACTQDSGKNKPGQMTDAQKAAYWKAKIIDVDWTTDDEGQLEGLPFAKMGAQTRLDSSGDCFVYFVNDYDIQFGSYRVVLTSESGELVNSDNEEEKMTVKFSEKNEKMFMTVSDGNTTVYYEEKQT